MSSYVFSDTAVGRPAITSHAAAGYQAVIPLGTIARAVDVASTAYGSGEFIYLKGLDTTALGTWVTYNADDWSTALLAANAIGPVAVAMSACVTGEYGWYQISGKAVGKALAAYADNGLVFATATAGSVDDAVVDGDMVHLAKGASALDTPATGLAEFEIHRPYTDDIASND
jgi:hypothetical protein